MPAKPGGQGQHPSADTRLTSGLTLAGRRILVTRPVDQAKGLKAAIEARGGVSVAFPLIRIVPPDDMQAARATFSAIASYGLVIFVSRNAVARGLAILRALAPDDSAPLVPPNVRVLAVGAGTAADLMAQGVPAGTVPGQRYDSESLLALDELGSGRIDRARVLIVKGEGGRDHLRRTLCDRGAHVDMVAAYARKPPQAGEADLSALWDEHPLDAIVLTSVEAAENLFALSSPALAGAPDVLPSPALAGAPDVLPSPALAGAPDVLPSPALEGTGPLPSRLIHRLSEVAYAVVSERVRAALASLAPQARAMVARGANDEALADAVVELMTQRPSSGG